MIKQYFIRINKFIQHNITWILPLITLIMIVLLVFSYLIPKKVIDTYKTNMMEEDGDEEYLIPLEPKSKITYHMNTGNRPIFGMHIGVAKNGNSYQDETIICKVYANNQKIPVSENAYLLNQGEDIQYAYIPFKNYEACEGDITIEFSFTPSEQNIASYPSILANGREITNAYTKINGDRIEGNIKNIYIYTHNTYPLVYDLRILVALFIALSMTINYKSHRREQRLK